MTRRHQNDTTSPRPAAHLAADVNPRFALLPYQRATEAVAELALGARIVGLTKGQFSLLDLLRALLAKTGPAHVWVSTWTTGIRDAENAAFLLSQGDLLSFRLLTDRSFPARQPRYCARLVELFGAHALCLTRTHAKFALVWNDHWNVTIRSSMNLNRNPRFEQFDLDDDAALLAFFRDHAADLAERMPAGPAPSQAAVDRAFRDALGGGVAEGVEGYDLDELLQPEQLGLADAGELGLADAGALT